MTRGRPARASRPTQAVVATDAFGHVRTWDAGAVAMLGQEAAAVVGRPIAEVVLDTGATQVLAAQRGVTRGESWSGELGIARSMTDPLVCRVEVTPVTDDKGLVLAAVWTFTDTRAQRRLEQTLRRLSALVDSSGDAVINLTPDGVITSWNSRAEEIYGYGGGDVIGRHVSMLAPHRTSDVEETLDAIRAGELRRSYETTDVRDDGTRIEVLVTVVAVYDADGVLTGVTATSRDLTQMRQLERELSHRDAHDELTGLPNRRALERRLARALEQARLQEGSPDGQSVAVLFVDVDRFATVNEAWGHAAGDVLLAEIAERLRGAVRASDFVARFGGDEFVVLCERASSAHAQAVAARVQRAVADPIQLNGHRLAGTVSIGVAVTGCGSTGGASDAQTLLRFAAAAAADAKLRGRAQTRIYDSELAHRAQTRLNFASELGAALADDKLELRYQPIFDVQTGAVLGIEALTRWVHPVHGNIAPAEFLRLAEHTGLITDLDTWALRRACADAARLLKAGVLPTTAYVAVNVSERTLVDPNLASLVTEALLAAKLPAKTLVLEITETGMMTDPDAVERALHALHARGVGIALDDFGTGYASLAHLRRFPLTSLKIDRVFVESMTNDRDELTIVASVVDLARALGVTTIAEGVETRQQLELLRRLGCPAAQGFLWTEALSPTDLNRLLTNAAGEPLRALEPQDEQRPTVVAGVAGTAICADPASDDVTAEHGLRRLLQLHQEGQSPTTIAAALNADGYRTPQGQRWHSRTVSRALARLALPAA